MRKSTLCRFLLCWLAISVLAPKGETQVWAQGGSKPTAPVARPAGNGQVSMLGPSQACPNTASDPFVATGPFTSWSWEAIGDAGNATPGDGRAISIVSVPNTNRSTAIFSFPGPGTYTVSVDTGTGYAERTITVSDNIPGVITTSGTTSQLSATSATICQGNTLQLVPPGNSTNWTWSGANVLSVNTIGAATIQPVADYNTYSLTYSLSGSSCPITCSFVVNVASPAGKVEVLNNGPTGNNWHYGTGVFTFAVKDPDPLSVYSWYDSLTSTTALATGTTWTTYVTQSSSYYVSASVCQERTAVPVQIRHVQLLANGVVPTGPIRLMPGTPITLQANSQLTGPLAWFFNGLQLTNQTGTSLVVTQLGRYSVRTQYPGDLSPENASQAIDVVDKLGLDNQVLNGQPLTYVSDTQVLKAGVTTAGQVAQLAVADRTQSITYLTGWGQPLQQVAAQAGPAQQDIVQHYSYAGSSTSTLAYQPVPIASWDKSPGIYESSPVSKLNAYYGLGESAATMVTEASPLARPISQVPVGSAWASHPNQVSYATNTALDGVRLWHGLDGSSTYTAGQLSKEILLDADGRRTEIYKDGLGRTILQRKTTGYGGASPQNFDTYSVYAAVGYLQYVIPPMAVNAMATASNWGISTMPAGFADQWLYQYTYDDQGRLVERKFPGAAAVYLVYDKFDRPILVQDGNHRASNQWLFTKFDAQNRPVVSGLYTYNNQTLTVRKDLQYLADATTLSAEFETRTAGGYTTKQTFPDATSGAVVLSMTVFDDYDLDQNGSADYSYTSQGFSTVPEPTATTQLRGLSTISKARVVQPGGQYGDWLLSVLFYDQYGNLIQKKSNNLLQTGSAPDDVTTLAYREQGFVPQVLCSLKTQQTAGLPNNFSPVVSVRNRYRYDAGGRLLQTWQQHQWKGDWEPEVLVSTNTYADLGELTQKQLHSRDGVNYLQTEDFAYNRHGQLKSINNSEQLLVSNPDNDLFALDIIREQQVFALGNTPRYDGGISAVTWAAHNAAQTNQPELQRSYQFAYDGLGRMTDALYRARPAPYFGWGYESGAYDEKNIVYDANGNMQALQRYTQASASASPTLLDNLSFTYTGTGNQHSKVDDTGDITRGFKDVRTTQEYAYDPNGSIIRDDNKGVTYTYNALNKVEKQTVGTGSLNYTYDAAGTVLKRETVYGGITAMTEYYIDGFAYQAYLNYAGLLSVPTSEGRALVGTKTDSRLLYEYHLRDHLGNLRVAFRAQAGTEDLRLSSEDPDQEERAYPWFQNVKDSQSKDVPAYDGDFEAAVSNSSKGPLVAIPVSDLDHIKVRVYYHTPNGEQTYRPAPNPMPTGITTQNAKAVAWTIAPTVLPAPTGREQSAQAMPGIQLSLTGLLSRIGQRPKTPAPVPLPAAKITGTVLNAYLLWTLTDANGQVVNSGTVKAPATDQSKVDWVGLDMPLDIDLSSGEARTGTLSIQELNDGSQPVYFDSLTITHPLDQALVTQENHYYPLGMALSGVAVNTIPQVPNVSKDQFNDGSSLQDDLLGVEGGVYSTFFRTYDPATGRFTGVDPLAEVTPDWTPYQFALGNPIAANDPTGALSQADIQFLYNMLDLVNGSGSGGGGGGISGILLSFGGGGGNMGDFISGVAAGTVSHIGYENGQLSWGGINYLGDGNGNPLPNTGIPWSYSLSVGTGGNYPVGLRQFLAIVVGEAKDSPDAATGIGSTLINRMTRNHVTLNDPDWAVKSLMPNERAKDASKQQASGAYQILRSKNSDVTSIMDKGNSLERMVNGPNPTIRAAYLAYTKLGKTDFSNGALYWNATEQKNRKDIGINFEYLKAGIYIQTAVLGNTTFFAPNPNRRR